MARKVIESGMRNMSKKLFAEFLGTFALVFLGAGAIVSGKADLQGVALAHGLAIFVSISALAGISGAHFNPAVSAVIDRKSTRLNSSHVALSRMPSSA